jgi:uncharacterized protein
MNEKIINCHSHVFNFEIVPDSFLGNYLSRTFAPLVAKILRIRILSGPMLFILKNLTGGNFRKLIDFAMIGHKKTIEEVFNDMRSGYQSIYPEARFVVLTMNFDHMDSKGYRGLFNTQLKHVKDLKQKYPNELLPFLGIDPRMELHGQDIHQFLTEYFNPIQYSGFVGLKLYPSLGFYPFHPRLEPVYQFAIEHDLPIMTHCTPDGAYWADKTLPQHLQFPLSFNPVDANTPIPPDIRIKCINLKNEIQMNYSLKPNDFCDYFLHPLNYWDVLLKYPKLKLCLAHTGGEETIKGTESRNIAKDWYEDIKMLLKDDNFPNLFADVSFVLSDEKVVEQLLKDLQNGSLPVEKMLFGTDFFMTVRIKKEKDLVEDFRKKIGEKYWKVLAVENPKRYISSKFYKA